MVAGSVQLLLAIILAEQIYPDYKISQSISSLGVGPSAPIFNTSLFLEGLLAISASYFLHIVYHNYLVTGLFILGGAGAVGLAIFPQNVPTIHLAISIAEFFGAGLTPFATLRFQKPPLTYISVMLGAFSFAAAILLAIPEGPNSLGLAFGTVERFVAYPAILWAVCFGSYLMTKNPI